MIASEYHFPVRSKIQSWTVQGRDEKSTDGGARTAEAEEETKERKLETIGLPCGTKLYTVGSGTAENPWFHSLNIQW